MEKNLEDLRLVSGEIKLTYTHKDAQGATVTMSDSVQADPAWVALLMRYVRHHKEIDQHGSGAMEISLDGSCGDYPAVETRRWHPDLTFTG